MGVKVIGSNNFGWVVKNCADIELAQAAILQAGGTRGSTFEMISPVCVFDLKSSIVLDRLCCNCAYLNHITYLDVWECIHPKRKGVDPVRGKLTCSDARKNTDGFCGRDGEFFHLKD